MKFISKRNEVHLQDGLVHKRVCSAQAAKQEATILKHLHSHHVPVPQVLNCRGNLLVLEHLPGEALPDLIERGDYEPEALAHALCAWLAAFYAAMPGLARGDVNGRNFLYDGKIIRSVDFEECPSGFPASDAGRLTAFIETYDTLNQEKQAILADIFAQEFCKRFGCSPEEIAAARELELAAMRKRRAAG